MLQVKKYPIISTVMVMLVWGSLGCTDATDPSAEPHADPQEGATEFISADGRVGEEAGGRNAGPGTYGSVDATVADDEGGDRTVEEGDIYRVLDEGKTILNLNQYRGLQVIDISDLTAPKVVGRLQVTGHPVEMYVVGKRAYMLVNNWQSYYGSRNDVDVESYNGGLLLVADISNPQKPVEVDRELVPGNIQTSRLIGNEVDRALYIAASNWRGDTETVVKSFSIDKDGAVSEQTTLSLGGYVQDIQATPEALLVSRNKWDLNLNQSFVAVIDVSNPDGTMIEGAEIEVKGQIQKKTNMSLHKNVLRLVSGSSWSGNDTNHLETFDVTDINKPVALDHDTFGEGEQLYATLFLENKAFFVTYFRIDPFHAFEITDEGVATEKAEYIVTGWNDWFKPVMGATRLIGIGTNDEENRVMAVSLYDITDLSNPNPFIDRKEVAGADHSWSEASWEDRAFSVLENAVSIAAEDGTVETGLVLLPFQGWDEGTYRNTSAVQIFTFSESTLTQRGTMDHDSNVRRSFMAKDSTTANLSENSMALFDTSDPDAPTQLGHTDLAPNYSDFLIFGDYGVRIKRSHYGYWGEEFAGDSRNTGELQVISLDGDPDRAAPLATLPISGASSIQKVGDLAVLYSTSYRGPKEVQRLMVQVIDLSDPLKPVEAATIETDPINSDYYGGYGPMECFAYYTRTEAHVVGDNLVFVESTQQEKVLGKARSCNYYSTASRGCWEWEDNTRTFKEGCTSIEGGVGCIQLQGKSEVCSGSFVECDNKGCEEIDLPLDGPGVEENCYNHDQMRYWRSFTFHVLSLDNPDKPVFLKKIAMPATEEDISVLARDDSLYVTYSETVEVEGDDRPYVKYFYKEIDLSTPQKPAIADGINIPGMLLEVDGDHIYTGDLVYGSSVIETALNHLEVKKGKAVLLNHRRFEDKEVKSVIKDANGNIVVVYRDAMDYTSMYGYIGISDDGSDIEAPKDTLAILDGNDQMATLSELEIDSWSNLLSLSSDRAIFTVPGGVLIVSLTDPEKPEAQAYYAYNGWSNQFTSHEDTLYISAGNYGIYAVDMNVYNLLEKE